VPEPFLYGAVSKPERPIFSLQNWFNGHIQEYLSSWLDANLGLRNYFIKSDNQLNYWLFNEIHQKTGSKIVVGKDDYLFEENYIRAHFGQDAIALEKMEERIGKLKTLQTLLQKQGIVSFFLISPNKVAYYSDYIPVAYSTKTASLNRDANYQMAIKLLRQYDVDYFDGRDYFEQNKEKSEYLLFPKGGTHWSYYGSCLVTQEILNKIGKQSQKTFVVPNCNKVDVLNESLATDGDLSDLSNLWFRGQFNEPLAYPRKIELAKGRDNDLNMLIIGDSFVWNILQNLVFTNGPMLDAYDFYYYFNTNTSYPSEKTAPVKKDPESLRTEILKHNVLIIEANEAALNDIGFGFIDAAIDSLR
jgi:hypothetical protein